MKKTAITIFTAFSLLLLPTALTAQDNDKTIDKPLTERLKDKVVIEKTERSNEIESRLNEIYEMDKSDMSFGEKRALRKEVRSIEKTTSAGGGGIYISVGGLLLIIILLIILL